MFAQRAGQFVCQCRSHSDATFVAPILSGQKREVDGHTSMCEKPEEGEGGDDGATTP